MDGLPANWLQRKHPVHGVKYIDGQPTIVFDTVCTRDRQPWLATEETHQLLIEVWQEATAWLVGRYMIMPDHIHLFAAATANEVEFKSWMKYWKSLFSKKHKNSEHRWQTDDWDTRMRNVRQYEEKWEYTRRNALRHKLVVQPEDWPYQGILYEIRWDDV